MFDIQFVDEVKGFARPEFLIILISFVYGFSISDQFFHLAAMIKQRKFYHETIIWSLVVTFGIIIYWYFLWENVEAIDKNLLVYASNFFPAFFLFLTVAFLYPGKTGNDYDPKETFIINRKWIFTAIILFVSSLILNTWWLDQLFRPTNYVRLGHIVFLIPCIVSSKRIFRYIAASWYLLWYFLAIVILQI